MRIFKFHSALSVSQRQKFIDWALSFLPKDTHPSAEQWKAVEERLAQYKCEECNARNSLVVAYGLTDQHAEVIIDCKECAQKQSRAVYAIQSEPVIKRKSWWKRIFGK